MRWGARLAIFSGRPGQASVFRERQAGGGGRESSGPGVFVRRAGLHAGLAGPAGGAWAAGRPRIARGGPALSGARGALRSAAFTGPAAPAPGPVGCLTSGCCARAVGGARFKERPLEGQARAKRDPSERSVLFASVISENFKRHLNKYRQQDGLDMVVVDF